MIHPNKKDFKVIHMFQLSWCFGGGISEAPFDFLTEFKFRNYEGTVEKRNEYM